MAADVKALLQGGADEAVSVNQRALVEKILARYSGEYTLFRELLQNADDASSSTVEIHFRTSPDSSSSTFLHSPDNLPDLMKHKVGSFMVRNDGIVFRDEDWNRLKKIAEGNPDESKIGAFGVGFYSLFSICDEPVVISGSKLMGFFWKDGGDQLYVKTANTAPATSSADRTPSGKPWTTFLMELRERAPMPEPAEFARFCATCLGFTQNVRNIAVYFDGHLLLSLAKTLAPPRPLPLLRTLPLFSPQKILHIESVSEVPLQLRAEVSRWLVTYTPASPTKEKPKAPLVTSGATPGASLGSVASSFASKMLSAFSSPSPTHSQPTSRVATPTPAPLPPVSKDPFALSSSTLFLRTVSLNLGVTPTSHFGAEMIRSTKKKLPTKTVFGLVWTGYEEYINSFSDSENGGSQGGRMVFEGLLSRLDRNGRVFIGFPTFQTTGFTGSIAARFVSTVERESIDFQASYVAAWNKELLWAGGVLARTVYEQEMSEIAKLFKSAPAMPLDEATKLKLHQRALHVMQFFTFTPSTPSPIVSSSLEASFYTLTASLTLPTQLGPLPASSVRLPNPSLSSFIKNIPVIPTVISDGCPKLIASYRAKNLVRDISLDDVFADLRANVLSVEEAVECFKWWLILARERGYNPSLLAKLKDSALLSVSEAKDGKEDVRITSLGSFKTFVNPKVISLDLPLSESNLPFPLTRSFGNGDLTTVFGFEELGLAEWIRFVTSEPLAGKNAKAETNLLVSPHFAEKILNVLAKSWTSLSPPKQKEITDILSPLPFVPTRQGSKLAKESYFSNVNLFDDLALVTLPSGGAVKGGLEKVLLALEVRRHVELQLVFSRLLGAGDWSHADVARYLVSVRDTLKGAEIDRLRKTAWLPKEGEARVEQPPGPDGVAKPPKVVRRPASELYEPTESLRALGLPLLDWPAPNKWRTNSEEAKLLFDLHLRRTPPVEKVLEIASSPDNPIRQAAALKYFLTEYETAGYSKTYSPAKHDFAFIPSILDNQQNYRKPSQVFSNATASLLGFPILVEALQSETSRLRISQDPPASDLVAALVKAPPKDIGQARLIFSYLSSQVSRFMPNDLNTLQAANIIPIPNNDTGKVQFFPPSGCFFSSDATLPPGLKSFFQIVPDFGPASKPFLVQVGVKESPSPQEVATLVVQNPAQFFDLSGSSERYLSILRMIAINYTSFSGTLKSRMKLSPFFLGTQRVANPSSKPSSADDDEEEAGGSLVYKLSQASALVINDDPPSFRIFEEHLVACPQEDGLEALASALGAPKISRIVTEDFKISGDAVSTSKRAIEVQRAVSERAFLFLADRQQYSKSDLKHDADWLKSHLDVYEVRSIHHVSTLSGPSGSKRSQQSASACVKVAPKTGNLQLCIAGDTDVDYYEVAHSLCRHLLVKPRSQDSLLLLTILTTSLKNLKRRGFNVDRILNARQAERDAADLRFRQERLSAQQAAAAESRDPIAVGQKQLEELFPTADPDYLKALLQSEKKNGASNEDAVSSAANTLITTDYPKKPPIPGNRPVPPPPSTSTPALTPQHAVAPPSQSDNTPHENGTPVGGFLSQFKKKLRSGSGSSGIEDRLQRMGSGGGLLPGSFPTGSGNGAGVGGASGEHDAGSTPTSTDAIRSNVKKAIQASRPDSSSAVNSVVDKTSVRESESTYCDSSHATDLVFVANIAGLRFLVSKDVTDGQGYLQANQVAISRYITQVVRPIGEVFQMDPRALHVFYDTSGPLIAFNRGGAIYLNFRYYLAWHDEQVRQGKLHDALISNYHSVAHELAHNLVKPHDSQFAFYASSITEMYFLRMAQLLQATIST